MCHTGGKGHDRGFMAYVRHLPWHLPWRRSWASDLPDAERWDPSEPLKSSGNMGAPMTCYLRIHGKWQVLSEDIVFSDFPIAREPQVAQNPQDDGFLSRRLKLFNSEFPDKPSMKGIAIVLNREITNINDVQINYLIASSGRRAREPPEWKARKRGTSRRRGTCWLFLVDIIILKALVELFLVLLNAF
ncbi:hypothetical protein B0H14DRAFT_2562080 [Mycena olivaceomarginata]|nr:hypothetical protein B0H14DRAFT_2562080 [Mycena olivaceomarginata]